MLRAPTVKRGQRLTAGLWNELAQAVNEGLSPPRDLESGVESDEVSDRTEIEVQRTTATERVFSPDDESVYIDVDYVVSVTMRDTVTGKTITYEYEP